MSNQEPFSLGTPEVLNVDSVPLTQLDNNYVIAGKKFLDGKLHIFVLTSHTVEVIGEIKPLGFLTDCSEESETPYEISFSDQISLSNQITTKYLQALLSSIYCHPMSGLGAHQILSYLCHWR
ncbi:unnamed protein product [Rhizophagus irregularis]|nr:unnamed protein product [Rhizophagus irregularis]